MTEIRFLRRHARLAALLGVTAAIVFSGVAVAAVAPVEGTSSLTAWTNSTPTIDAGESVTFKNTSATTPHGVGFDAPPVAPGCTGVPGAGDTSWEGSCTFSQAGSYPFHCTVHPAMTGTVTVQSTGPEKPAVTTGTASAITDVGATLGGSVNPNGLETEYFFKYGTDTNYGQTTGTTTLSAGTSSVAASKAVAGLSPGTTYHFRLVATNTSGTTEGGD